MDLFWEIIYWSGLHLAFAYPLFLFFKISITILNAIEAEGSNKRRQRIYLILCCLAVLTIEALVFTKALPHWLMMLQIFINLMIPSFLIYSKMHDKQREQKLKENGNVFIITLIYIPLIALSMGVAFAVTIFMMDLTNKMDTRNCEFQIILPSYPPFTREGRFSIGKAGWVLTL